MKNTYKNKKIEKEVNEIDYLLQSLPFLDFISSDFESVAKNPKFK